MEYGYIITNVRTARGAIPIKGAMVTVSRVKDDAVEIISIEHTDSGGATPKIKVETPPKEYTFDPNSDEKPYASYMIDTDMEGYYGVRNINIPVYADVVSIQTVDLIPVAEYAGRDIYPEDELRFNESTPPNL